MTCLHLCETLCTSVHITQTDHPQLVKESEIELNSFEWLLSRREKKTFVMYFTLGLLFWGGPVLSFQLFSNLWRFCYPGEGGSFPKIVRGCACRTSKIWLSLYQFFAKFPTHQYTIFERKAPNLDQIGCFLQQFAQNTPNLCNLGSFVSDENPPIAIPNFAKKYPKRQAHIRIPCQCENPPPPRGCYHKKGHIFLITHGKFNS